MNEQDGLERGISVIICTHNGAMWLPQTLQHLAKQQMPESVSWEIVLVDNASTDGSAEVANTEWDKFGEVGGELVCIHEAKPGKYFALQAAMACVRYAYFIICDDDNWLSPTYLYKVMELLDGHPEVGALGGRGIPVTEGNQPLPHWFDRYQEGYAVGPQGRNTGDVSYKGHLWGAGLASRTALYRSIYDRYPSFLLLHDNPEVLCAEDSEYCLRLVLRGYRLFYDDKLLYQHFISGNKLTEAHITRLYRKYEESYAVIGKYLMTIALYKQGRIQWTHWLRYAFRAVLGKILAKNRKQRIKVATRMTYLFSFKRKPDEVGRKIRMLMNDQTLPQRR